MIQQENQHADFIQALEIAKSNNDQDIAGNSLLHIASQFGELKHVEEYVQAGFNINAKNNFGKTPLHLACFSKKQEIVQFLLAHGANIDDQDDFGNSAIHVCAAITANDIAKLLTEKGANLNKRDIYGCSVLHQCAVVNNYELVPDLLKTVFVDVLDKFNNTPLSTACHCGSAETALLLAKSGANIRHKNMYGTSPLETINELTRVM